MLYPLKLKSPLKDYIWGGHRLKEDFNKEGTAKIAESWELACHKDGCSIIENGRYKGLEFSKYLAKKGEFVLGTRGTRYAYFPLMIKIIDAAQNLSIQVHPDDAYALANENEYGTTEMWYILEAAPDAEVIHGLKRDMTKEELAAHVADGTLLDVVNRVKVKPGDVFFIEAGDIHSIGAGVVMLEIKQNTNTNYRLYDYGRTDENGSQRELQIEKALAVARPTRPRSLIVPKKSSFFYEYDVRLLAECEFFTAYHFDMHGRCHLRCGQESFQSIVVLGGLMEIEYSSGCKRLEKGDSYFVPAKLGDYWIRGTGEFVLTLV